MSVRSRRCGLAPATFFDLPAEIQTAGLLGRIIWLTRSTQAGPPVCRCLASPSSRAVLCSPVRDGSGLQSIAGLTRRYWLPNRGPVTSRLPRRRSTDCAERASPFSRATPNLAQASGKKPSGPAELRLRHHPGEDEVKQQPDQDQIAQQNQRPAHVVAYNLTLVAHELAGRDPDTRCLWRNWFPDLRAH